MKQLSMERIFPLVINNTGSAEPILIYGYTTMSLNHLTAMLRHKGNQNPWVLSVITNRCPMQYLCLPVNYEIAAILSSVKESVEFKFDIPDGICLDEKYPFTCQEKGYTLSDDCTMFKRAVFHEYDGNTKSFAYEAAISYFLYKAICGIIDATDPDNSHKFALPSITQVLIDGKPSDMFDRIGYIIEHEFVKSKESFLDGPDFAIQCKKHSINFMGIAPKCLSTSTLQGIDVIGYNLSTPYGISPLYGVLPKKSFKRLRKLSSIEITFSVLPMGYYDLEDSFKIPLVDDFIFAQNDWISTAILLYGIPWLYSKWSRECGRGDFLFHDIQLGYMIRGYIREQGKTVALPISYNSGNPMFYQCGLVEYLDRVIKYHEHYGRAER